MSLLLPPNWTKEEYELAGAVRRISDVPFPISEVWNANTCPSALLPWLAWAMQVEAWDPTWTDAQKRQAILDSDWIHRHKGTPAALVKVLQNFGISAVITEWWQTNPAGIPYTFTLTVAITPQPVDIVTNTGLSIDTNTGDDLTNGQMTGGTGETELDPVVMDAIDRVKPVRSELLGINGVNSHGGTLNIIGYVVLGTFTRIRFSTN